MTVCHGAALQYGKPLHLYTFTLQAITNMVLDHELAQLRLHNSQWLTSQWLYTQVDIVIQKWRYAVSSCKPEQKGESDIANDWHMTQLQCATSDEEMVSRFNV